MAKRRLNPFARRREEIGATIVASARRIDLKNADEVKKWVKKPQEWQDGSWTFFDLNGQIKFGINFKANVLSKVRLYVGKVDPSKPNEDPERVEDGAAVDALDLLRDGLGSHGELLRRASVNLDVPGEFYIVGLAERIGTRPVDPTNQIGPTEQFVEVSETWGLYSTEELKVAADGKLKLRTSGEEGSRKEIEIDSENDFVLRVWFPHPRFADQADSPLRGVLGDAEDIHDMRQMMRACDNSRLSAGLFIFPSEETRGLTDPTNVATEGGDERQDPVMELLEKATIDAVEKSDSPARVAPTILRIGKDNVESARWIDIGRKVTTQDLERWKMLNDSLEQGLPVPVGSISGVKDVNHWGAWQIDESAFTMHAEPSLLALCNSLTTGFLRPYLTAVDGPNMPEDEAAQYVIWYDASAVVKDPDPKKTADDAFDKKAVSWEWYREQLGIPDDAAPSDEELAMRLGAERGSIDTAVMLAILQRLLPELVPSPDATNVQALPPGQTDEIPEDETGEEGPPPEEEREGDGPEQQAVTAAAPRRARRDLGTRLRSLDQGLRTRLQASWHQAMGRALDRAGAKALSAIPKGQRRALGLDRIEARHVVRALGAERLAEFGLDEDRILEGAFDYLEAEFREWTRRAQEHAVNLVPRLPAHLHDATLNRMMSDLDTSWQHARGRLMALARDRLYDPNPETPAVGEWDAGVLIPFGLVRDVVARAGGATDSGAWTGIGSGPTLTVLLGEQGVKRKGFRWVYGDFPRSNPFPPHEDLDGVEFDNFDDEELANAEGWPNVNYFMPGDHDGCVCDFEQILEDEMAIAASLAGATA
jgi:hypothetical protein